MPIDPKQQLDRNERRYGLPVDSCVGDAGPSPAEVTREVPAGGKAVLQQPNPRVPVGYDGP